jgi:transcription initiation factor IIE alpha subunit
VSAYVSAIWRALEGGDLFTPEELADEACIPRAAIRSILAAIDDTRFAPVRHARLPEGLVLYRRADRPTSLRDIHRKVHTLQRRATRAPRKSKQVEAAIEMQAFMIRFCLKRTP